MRLLFLALVGATAIALSGCHSQQAHSDKTQHHGRYAGIGVFSPSALWSKMDIDDPSKDKAAATTEDDDMIIAVVDSDTGEIRECGDYSGRCVTMNPWTKAIAQKQLAPISVTMHAAELNKSSQLVESEPLPQQQTRRQARQQ